jgi:DNA-binding beta-propeller fold protein YncE
MRINSKTPSKAPTSGRGGRRHRLALALTTALALILFALPASASAFTEWGFLGEFESPTEGSGPGQFNRPHRIAIDQGTGYLYVADTENDRIQVFKPEGSSISFLSEFGSAVPNFNQPVGLAIDQSNGDVYATSREIKAVNERQRVTIEGDEGGTFKLGFEGQSTGATGTGNVEEESFKVKNVHATSGTFVVGEFISG